MEKRERNKEVGRALIESEVRPSEKLPQFDGMTERDRELLLTKGRESKHCRGALIPTPKEESVCAVLSGEARLYLPGPDGRVLEEDRLRPGEVFLLGSVSRDEEDHIQARAMANDTSLLAIPSVQFLSTTPIRPSTVNWLMKIYGHRYAGTQSCLRERAFFCLKERLAHKLAELALENGKLGNRSAEDKEAIVRETREGLATMVGTRTEEVSRALGCLKEENLVRSDTSQRQIKLLDVEALKDYGRGRRKGSQKRHRAKGDQACEGQERSGVRRRV